MCEPATIGLALSAVSTGAGLFSQYQQGKSQESANQQQYENSMTAMRTNQATLEAQRSEASRDTSEQLLLNNKAGRAATATAGASAGEAGITGNSVAALLRDLSGRAALDNADAIETNLRQDQGINRARENSYNNTASQINTLVRPKAPDYIGAGLRIAGAAMDYKTAKAKSKQPI